MTPEVSEPHMKQKSTMSLVRHVNPCATEAMPLTVNQTLGNERVIVLVQTASQSLLGGSGELPPSDLSDRRGNNLELSFTNSQLPCVAQTKARSRKHYNGNTFSVCYHNPLSLLTSPTASSSGVYTVISKI